MTEQNQQRPARVAIVGGGCAAMTAAFELTRPELQGRFDVTVYQLGWRLGGKGASGRGPCDRIEEHGLHVWLGFYENAFRLMRDCYRELDRDPDTCPIAGWRDAFFSDPHVGMADLGHDGRWLQWTALFPPAPGEPGDPLDQANPFTLQGYMGRTLDLLKTLVFQVETRRAVEAGSKVRNSGGEGSDAGTDLEGDLLTRGRRLLRHGLLGTVTGLIEALAVLDGLVRALVNPEGGTLLGTLGRNTLVQMAAELLRDLAHALRRRLEAEMAKHDESRYVWEIIDLVVAIMVGILRDGLMFNPRGLDAINHKECRTWLLEHGASPRAVDSAFVRGLFDLAMAYPGGDARRPALAAGQAIRGSLRMFFTYRGALFWKMRAGMGDIVFAPLYEVLRRRGVRFEFFHRLENVGLSEDGSHVARLDFDVQAKVRKDASYEPLIDVNGLPCWPARPDYAQLVNGKMLAETGRRFECFWDRGREAEKSVHVGEDFDFVILGVGVGAVPHVCSEILAQNARWRDMAKHVVSVPSQAFQLWMREDMTALGWPGPAVTLSAFSKPFDTWADMRHLIPEENWPEPPAAIAYFCGVLPETGHATDRDDSGFPSRARDTVRENAVTFLNQKIAHLWPGAMKSPETFRWDILVDPAGAPSPADESAFDSQFWTANVNPSDRYTLAPPGSMAYRISPLDITYDNLTIAGDWTDCGFNEGCVEAAVMSGRLAAHALCGMPALGDIIGYDHP